MEFISANLKEQKQIEVIKFEVEQQLSKQYLIVKDKQNQQYYLKIIHLDDGNGQICQDKLQRAKENAEIIKGCSHKNIIKFKDEFILDRYFFIMLEKCEMTLQQWIDSQKDNTFNRQQFIKFSLQILEAANYTHLHSYFMSGVSTQNIFVDKDLQIKCSGLFKSNQFNPFEISTSVDETLFLPPEIVNFSKNSQAIHSSIEINSWSIGVCLYILARGNIDNLRKFQLNQLENLDSGIDDQEIITIISNILKQNPNERQTIPKSIESLRFLQNKSNDYEEQIDLINEQETFKKVQDLFHSQQEDASALLLIKLIKINPQNDEYKSWLGRVFKSLKDIKKCLYWSFQSLQTNPNNYLSYFNLANVFVEKQQTDRAIEYFSISIKLNPEFEVAHYNLGNQYKKIHKEPEAIECYKRCIQIEPKYHQAYYNVSFIYLNQELFNKANICLKQSIKINKQKDNAYNNLGNSFFQQKKYDQSLIQFKKAFKINQNNQIYIQNIRTLKFYV